MLIFESGPEAESVLKPQAHMKTGSAGKLGDAYL